MTLKKVCNLFVCRLPVLDYLVLFTSLKVSHARSIESNTSKIRTSEFEWTFALISSFPTALEHFKIALMRINVGVAKQI